VARKIYAFLLMNLLSVSLFIMQSEKSYAGSGEEVMTAEKLVEAHVKSIGSPALLAKITSRTFFGSADVNLIQGMNGKLKGTSMFVSQGRNLAIIIKFPDINYPGEYFAYDGKDITVGHISPGLKSPIAEFIFRFSKIMKAGLLGGTLSGAWPLLDIKNQNVEMKYRKTKIDGQELHEILYQPREGFGDIKIRMYFDPTTFRHVRTEYRVQIRGDASMGNAATYDPLGDRDAVKAANPDGSMVIGQARPDSYYTLIEKFEGYKKIGGMMFPHRYILDYSQEGNATFIANWTLNVGTWSFNAPKLDQKVFQAQK
jgi:hypothetical protein